MLVRPLVGPVSSTVALTPVKPFVDLVVEPVLDEFRPPGRRGDPEQAAGNRLRGFRERVAVLGAVEFDFFTGSFEAALQGHRVYQRHGFFADREAAAVGHREDAVGDRHPVQRALFELRVFAFGIV